MPVADGVAWVGHHLFVVGGASFIWDLSPEVNYSYHVIPSESVVIHDKDLQANVFNVYACDVKFKCFVEDWC